MSKIIIESLLGAKQKVVKNSMSITNVSDVDLLLKAVVSDRTATITREDGKEIPIVSNGTIYTEVFNQKELLVLWIRGEVDEFPNGGLYAKSSI